MSKIVERVLTLPADKLVEFCGCNDERIREIERQLEAKIIARGNELKVIGEQEAVEEAADVLEELLSHFQQNGAVPSRAQMRPLLNQRKNQRNAKLATLLEHKIQVPLRRRHITPLTAGQKRYLEALQKHDIVFSIGPAGTGKTYLAMAMAVNQLMRGVIARIILARPAVEAGERIGFLPGDIAEKFDPYVRPLWDALYEMLEPQKTKSYLETGIIEIAPLAFMRGRTLNNAYVILDEAQNTTIEQMKMFLTRLGFDSKAVITGDVTQIDLPRRSLSGLLHVQRILQDIKGISFIQLDQNDVVRHELVQKIINAYEREEKQRHARESSAEE